VELLTARRCNIAPVVVIFAEAPPLKGDEAQERILGRETCVDLVPVNYEEIARALDVGYVRIMRDAELESGLKSALTTEAPTVVEMRVAYRDAVSYLKAAHRADWQHKPRPLALRSGAGVILRRMLASR
jgi:thiamine pyrophosphate-dependent acetolactate synthase large subunit-like protein